MFEILILLIFVINIPIILIFDKLTKFININDKADNIRKFHKNDVPLFGGILIFFNLIILIAVDQIVNLNIFLEIEARREFFSFCIGFLLFFLIGIYDDKYNLSANKKLFLNFFIILFIILLDDSLVIKKLNFSFFDNPIYLKSFSHLFTVLCILLFLNALNMFDGVNLQAAFYCLIIFIIFLLKNTFYTLSIILILILILFLIYNFFNKSFLGDSGTQVLAFLISYILIKSHNANEIFTPEEIFVILSIPGIDMFRLFLFRIFKGKNPFSPDRSHIHHLILEKFNKFQTFVIIQVLILFNIFIFYILDNKLYTLLFIIFTYLALFFSFYKIRKKN